MQESNVRNIKRAQKESVLLHVIAELFLRAAMDDNSLSDLVVNRVKLSPDKRICYVYFYTNKGEAFFRENMLGALKLYRPSLRKAVANKVFGRYVPSFTFRYDESYEKQEKINLLIENLKRDGKL